jgi:hypothetical protein
LEIGFAVLGGEIEAGRGTIFGGLDDPGAGDIGVEEKV